MICGYATGLKKTFEITRSGVLHLLLKDGCACFYWAGRGERGGGRLISPPVVARFFWRDINVSLTCAVRF